MSTTLTLAAVGYLLVVALLAVSGAAGMPTEASARSGIVIAQVLVVVIVVADVVSLVRGHRPPERVTHIGYAVAALGVPPLLLYRRPAPGEAVAPKPHLAVIAVAAVVTAVVLLRLQATWS